MNNFTFGDATMGYYETIAGGAGAGPTWHGRSGVHTHMTNTRITGDSTSFHAGVPANVLSSSYGVSSVVGGCQHSWVLL